MPVEIIAEIGINHNRDFDIGACLIVDAKIAGADAVKFQASVPDLETSGRHAPEHLAMIRDLVPTFDLLRRWKAVADQIGIEFLCTPAEEESLEFLMRLGVRRLKIASDNLLNGPFLRACWATRLPLIISTGMASMVEVGWALGQLTPWRAAYDVTLLHCVSAYPTPVDEMNLRAITALRNSTGLPVGLSDHSRGMLLPAIAVGLGAVMIEKHITFNPDAPGPDHKSSMIPQEFAKMVSHVRLAEEAMGDGDKVPQPCEFETIRVARKSIVAAGAIQAGEPFRSGALAIKRPGTGMSPTFLKQLIGRKASRDYAADEQIDGAEIFL